MTHHRNPRSRYACNKLLNGLTPAGLAALQAVEGAEYAGGAIAWSHTDGLRGRIHHSAAEWLFERRLVKRKKDTSGGTPVYLTTKEGRKLLALARKTAAIQ